MEIRKLIGMKHFFNIASNNNDTIIYKYKKPSLLIWNNVYIQWLKSIWIKAENNFPVHLNKQLHEITETTKLPVGLIETTKMAHNENTIFEHNMNRFAPDKVTNMNFKLVVPEDEAIQYFLQWQRYRKYWWSSVTTTPGIFSIQDKQESETDDPTQADIVINLPWKQQVVESTSILTKNPDMPSKGVLHCSFNMETGLMAILSDAMISYNKEEYLRLHRKIAPYKLSFAIDSDDVKIHCTLQDLVKLLNSRLTAKNISTWLPDFSDPFEQQVRESRLVGAPYAAVVDARSLRDGVLRLTSSSTRLSEQTHVAIFDEYASFLCGK